MSLLITGGSGTLAREIIRQIQRVDSKRRIVVYSRDEGKQSEMMREFPEGGAFGIRYMLGDIRDVDRLSFALRGINEVIHTAAIKMIDWADYNAFETISVNTNGSMDVAKACIRADVKRAVIISTDKAADGPVGVYGQSKLLAETIFIDANNYGATKFNVCRYGNVAYAAKSCFHLWEKQAAAGEPVTVTEPDMTRFFWSIEEAGAFVLRHIQSDERGVIFVPKMHGYRMIDLARKYSENIKVIGTRCPEKMHEALWSLNESSRVRDCEDYYAIYPHTHQWCADMNPKGKAIRHGFKLTSEIASVGHNHELKGAA